MYNDYFNYYDRRLREELYGGSWGSEEWTGADPFEDRELSEMICDALDLINYLGKYRGGDDTKSYFEEKKKFKDKWLKNPRIRVKHVIDTAVDELRQAMYKTYGIENKT